MQSAPANPQPRNAVKPRAPREAQARPKDATRRHNAAARPAPGVDEPLHAVRRSRGRASGLPPAGERRFNHQ